MPAHQPSSAAPHQLAQNQVAPHDFVMAGDARGPVTATVDLEALHHNLRLARDRAAGAAVLLAVKADAYGHGAVAIASSVQASGLADALGVAWVSEATALRQAGITLPILKLSHCRAGELTEAIAADLWLTVVDETTIDEAERAAASAGVEVVVHLKLDTGMGRIGSPADRAVELASMIDSCAHLRLEGLFTHLPSADVDPAYTQHQLGAFLAATAQVNRLRTAAGQGEVRFVHASNSAAVLRHHRPEFTLVRPGIMAYGYSPDPVAMPEPDLRPVMTWTTTLTFLKHVPAGTTIGYGRTWTADRDSWIGTLGVGYGDGFSRLNSSRGQVLVGGRPVPVVGRVCMDQTMINFGPERPDVTVGDEVVLIGRSGDLVRTADDLAELMGTISYEVLCLVGARVPRVTLTAR